ncbi:MAG: hypothetical protein GX102_06480 [Porphyromonadaceae bacterium]|nr:hypothetical protein [Porphyromonadaceae bacterium]
MKILFKFYKNKRNFVNLAVRHETTPFNVFRLALGKEPVTLDECEVLFDLKRLCILPPKRTKQKATNKDRNKF